MKTASRNKVTAVLSVLLALAIVSSPAFAAPPAPGNQNPGIAPINSRPHGKSYSEWAAVWQTTYQTIPAANNPIWGGVTWSNECLADDNHVWLLYGTSGGSDLTTRKCVISSGDAVITPIMNTGYAAFESDPPEQKTIEFFRQQFTCQNPVIHASLDGAEIINPLQYWEESVLFDMTMPEGNVYGLTAGTVFSPTIDWGYYLFLNPMKPGLHVLEWKATWDCGAPSNVVQNVRYEITVTK